MSKRVITKENEHFETMTEDWSEKINVEVRRGSNFFCNLIYDTRNYDELPEDLRSLWMSNRLIGDHDHGTPCDSDELIELTEVHEVEETITVKRWKPLHRPE